MMAWGIMLFWTAVVGTEKPAEPRGNVIVIVGSPGTDEYGRLFSEWGDSWVKAAEQGGWRVHPFGTSAGSAATLEAVQQQLVANRQEELLPLWIVLIGHGTFDGRDARFNLPGPDLGPQDLLKSIDDTKRPVAIVLCFSSSAPFIPALSAPARTVIAATRSGNEGNFSRFGGYLAKAIADPAADLDKDEQVSLLEAFLKAARDTGEFYEGEGRLATEHAVLEDNGDGRPVSADGFAGLLPENRNDQPGQLPDGLASHQWHLIPNDFDAALSPAQLARRNELEQDLARLRTRKHLMSQEAYYSAVESFALELARLVLPQKSKE